MSPRSRRRWILAFALSIALNEIVIGLLAMPPERRHADKVAITPLVFERPAPTPRPTPPPVVHVPPHATPAPVPQIAAAKAAGPKAPVHGGAPSHPVKHVNLAVYQELAHTQLGHAHGAAGTGSGAGTGAAIDGGGDNGTQGTGSGAVGSGTGAVNANTPCGDVFFLPVGEAQRNGSAIAERVKLEVHFPDGHVEQDQFPYRWVYQNGERDDPWSQTNVMKERNIPDKDLPPVYLVFPPPGTDTSSYSPLVNYIIAHTRPDGSTVLLPCPTQH